MSNQQMYEATDMDYGSENFRSVERVRSCEAASADDGPQARQDSAVVQRHPSPSSSQDGLVAIRTSRALAVPLSVRSGTVLRAKGAGSLRVSFCADGRSPCASASADGAGARTSLRTEHETKQSIDG